MTPWGNRLIDWSQISPSHALSENFRVSGIRNTSKRRDERKEPARKEVKVEEKTPLTN